MYSISLQDFRGFHKTGFIELRPITLLVGENSAGKSSFLGALRYLLDFMSGKEIFSFNKDPFHLGTFHQIAHYRGGKAGRARSFSLSLKGSADLQRSSSHKKFGSEADIKLCFTPVESNAAISSIIFSSVDGSIHVTAETDGIVVQFRGKDGTSYDLRDLLMYRGLSKADFGRYWQFLIRDINFTLGGAPKSPRNLNIPDEAKKAAAKLARYYSMLSHSLSIKVEATSAIRTKPLRTYTPGADIPDAEGTHVPFEIAKLSRSRNKEEWRQIKKDIEKFGASSETFKHITVKSFGATASDPFQLQFSLDGPRMNLVDLGYGTSQVLPIIYALARSGGSPTRFLIQQPEVHLHPRAQAALGDYFVDTFKRSASQFVIETHSDFILDRIRSAIFRKRIQAADVSLIFFERHRLENVATVISLDEQGNPVDPPAGYRRFFLSEQLRIMGIDECL